MRRDVICGIDIGNSAVKTIIAELDRESLRPKVIGLGWTESRGLRRGVVIDIGETINNVGEALRQAETMAGTKVQAAYVSISGLHLRTQTSKGVIAVSRPDSQITQHDMDRVIEAASLINLPGNREIVHILPIGFTIDGQEQVKNPLDMKGIRLEAEVFIIDGLSTHIHNLAKCVNVNNVEVLDFVYSPLAASLAALDKQQKEYGVLNIDLGGATSIVSLFHEGELKYTKVLPIGSRHITNDLAVALRTTMDNAEKIKLEHGSLDNPGNLKVDLSAMLEEADFTIPKKELVKVIGARINELFDMIVSEIKNTPRHLLPGGVVFLGGGSNLQGLVNFAKDKLKLPVKVANHYHFDGMIIDQAADPSFAVAAGLVTWGLEQKLAGTPKSGFRRQAAGSPMFNKLLSWFKNFLP